MFWFYQRTLKETNKMSHALESMRRMRGTSNVDCYSSGKRFQLCSRFWKVNIGSMGRHRCSGGRSWLYSLVSFQWANNRPYPLNPHYVVFLSSCATVWGEDPWSNSRPHNVRETPTHHKAAWVSPKNSLPRTACTPPPQKKCSIKHAAKKKKPRP